MKTSSNIAIIGAGYIGLEVAAVAKSMGKIRECHRSAGPADETGGQSGCFGLLRQAASRQCIDLRLETGVEGLEGEAAVSGVRLKGGELVPAELVLIAVGAEPNDHLAAEAGLEVDNGVLVDGSGQTSDPDIYAVGDCTRFYSSRYQRSVRMESVQNAIDQAKAAASRCWARRSTTTRSRGSGRTNTTSSCRSRACPKATTTRWCRVSRRPQVLCRLFERRQAHCSRQHQLPALAHAGAPCHRPRPGVRDCCQTPDGSQTAPAFCRMSRVTSRGISRCGMCPTRSNMWVATIPGSLCACRVGRTRSCVPQITFIGIGRAAQFVSWQCLLNRAVDDFLNDGFERCRCAGLGPALGNGLRKVFGKPVFPAEELFQQHFHSSGVGGRGVTAQQTVVDFRAEPAGCQQRQAGDPVRVLQRDQRGDSPPMECPAR